MTRTKINIRIYTTLPLTSGSVVELDSEASHHICKVLRQQKGSEITLFNGNGSDFEATLVSTGKTASAAIGDAQASHTESPLQIHLLQAISRSDRMDHCIQKSVELGVSRVTPLFTERCSVKLNRERAARKTEHWRKIAISACEQSGRSVVPTIDEPVKIGSLVVDKTEPALKLILAPNAQQSIGALHGDRQQQRCERITLLVGAESGFTDSELAFSIESGFIPIKLGPRVLRTETAAPAALAVLQYLWGDL